MLGSLLRRVLPSRPEPVARSPNPFEPLGPRRQILLWCLGAADDPNKPTWFDPPKPGEDVFVLFADYADRVEPILLDGAVSVNEV